MKKCSRCKKLKKLDSFGVDNSRKDGLMLYCKPCWSEYKKTKSRKWYLSAKYSITENQYTVMSNKQKDCCAICGKHSDNLDKVLCVDHNHNTNKIRGLLCNDCNRALGLFGDSIQILENARNYLRRYE